MESFFVRYRNLLVLLVLLVAQILGLALQVHRTAEGQVSLDPRDSRGVRLIRLWANAMVSPPERAVQSSRSGVGWIWENYFDLRHVRQQNQDLQAEVNQLRLEQAELLEDAREGQRLEALEGFQQKYLYKTIPAQVIGGSGTDLSRVLYLDKGKDAGLARDMAVVTPDGIVGKIREVYPHSAQVLLINDQSSGAGVILEQTRIRGILRGNAEGQPAVVNILADQRIKPGEKVLTAGGDEIFPRGLSVGTIAKIVPDPDRDGFVQAIIHPAARLNGLDEVLIITDIEPHFNSKQQKDMARSQSDMGGEAAALAEQQKAAEILSERLPGLTPPNAPAQNGAQPGAPNGTQPANGAAQTPAAPPRLLTPAHPDRFMPGYGSGNGSADTTSPATKPPSHPAPKKPANPAQTQPQGVN